MTCFLAIVHLPKQLQTPMKNRNGERVHFFSASFRQLQPQTFTLCAQCVLIVLVGLIDRCFDCFDRKLRSTTFFFLLYVRNHQEKKKS